jgi:putative DNA topoisomerase
MSQIDHSLFSHHQGETPCPKCGSALQIKNSKRGPFLGCSTYPVCDFTHFFYDNQVDVVTEVDGASCPLCQSRLLVKKGRFGLFIGCENYPACHYIAPIHDNADTAVTCPSCGKGQLKEKTNRYGKLFYSCSRYPDCRYILNSKPVDKPCPKCGWKVLVKQSSKLVCPQKNCDFSQQDE